MKKIVHISLCGPVTDNFEYQDNILPKYHKKIGYKVSMITSKYIWNSKGELEKDFRSSYYNEYGVKTIRLVNKNNTTINSKFKRYKGLYKAIENENPDILFIHGVQFLDIKTIVNYLNKNLNIKVFVDNHADFNNSATNWLSRNILHKIIWKKYAKLIEPYVNRFYGVTPARVDFLMNVYDLPKSKIELLIMGADDEKVCKARKSNASEIIRKEYEIKNNIDFLIVTGGKIDSNKKEVLALMRAIKELPNPNIKLIVFGSVIPELESKFNELVDGKKIQYTGWVTSNDTYNYFESSDLVVFPSGHSVFWEQVAGQGIPMVLRKWPGVNHIDVGGNVEFLEKGSVKEIKEVINNIYQNKNKYKKMQKSAIGGMKKFSYSDIAKYSINCDQIKIN